LGGGLGGYYAGGGFNKRQKPVTDADILRVGEKIRPTPTQEQTANSMKNFKLPGTSTAPSQAANNVPIYGPDVSPMAGAGIGAGIGVLADGDDGVSQGAMIGGLGGAGIGALVNALAPAYAAATDRRTEEAQKEYEGSSALANWLVPGVAANNHWKRIGLTRNIDDAAKARRQKSRKADALEDELRARRLEKELEKESSIKKTAAEVLEKLAGLEDVLLGAGAYDQITE